VLAGDAEAVSRGFDQVIFPADRVRLNASRRQRRVQGLDPVGLALWIGKDQPLPEELNASTQLENDALERHRLQQGFPPGPAEMNGETNPLELGLSGRISLDKGCYLGQETMAKLTGKGGVKQQLRCWHSEQPLHPGDQLNVGSDRAGTITSALSHPGAALGLALVRRQFLDLSSVEGPTGQTVQLGQPAAFQEPPA
jgi:folate-binding protein YgfZ